MADWRAPLMSAVSYRDPKAALKFLEAGFGFEVSKITLKVTLIFQDFAPRIVY